MYPTTGECHWKINHRGTEIYTCVVGFPFRVRRSVSSLWGGEISFNTWLIIFDLPVLLNLHRPYFAQALQESPADLHRHRYLPSVVATYRSAWRLSRGLAVTWRAVPAILARLLLPWSNALSAAVSCHLSTKQHIHEQKYDFF